uniref:Carboxylic ester hydrolase n=1 Tax=Saccoglossus kowalevskii TaxID=10224 RepID=A0ABM0GZZ6_SACKO|nr:PREDICTED: acetylcholinesterase-like [Saccoglossus kowalevskii]
MRLAVFVGFTFACVFNSMCEIEEAVVATNYGELRGRRLEILGAKVDAFLGIPYADPPVGNTRFSPANPWSTEWSGVRNASSFGAACWQKKYPPPIDHPGHIWWTTTDECSEDCLFLNVWTPYPAPSDAPVVVFIHGGSLIAGTTSASLYNGATLAAVENVVVVSMNYRLGLLGFLSFFTENEPGNLGLLDQAMALLWVKDNIEHFGGNADSVTLIGHSAGAASVGLHLMSPASRPFFRRAILQSGAPNTGWTMTSRAQDLWVAGKLAKNVHCPTWLDSSNLSYESVVIDTLRCLRERGPQNLVNSDPLDASKTVGGYVVVDGFFLPDNPQLILADSDMKQTSIIIGTVDEESLLNMGHLPKFRFDIPKVEAVRNTYSADDYKQSIDLLFPYVDQSVRDVIWFEYRDWFDPNNGTKLHRSVIDMWEDFCMVCPIKEFANFYAEAGNNVYAYNYDHRSSKSPWKEWLGTVHADELLFTLGLAMHDDEGLEDMEKQLSRKILKYWGNYARTG